MVKIERVLDGAVATINRDGTELQLFQGQLIHFQDLESLKVVGGKVIYSIDETEVVEVVGIPAKAGSAPTEEVAKIVKETTKVTDEVEVVQEVAAPAPVTAKKK